MHPLAFASRDRLLARIDRPDADWPDARIIEAQICKIRQKLAGLTIRTVIGRGYVIDAE